MLCTVYVYSPLPVYPLCVACTLRLGHVFMDRGHASGYQTVTHHVEDPIRTRQPGKYPPKNARLLIKFRRKFVSQSSRNSVINVTVFFPGEFERFLAVFGEIAIRTDGALYGCTEGLQLGNLRSYWLDFLWEALIRCSDWIFKGSGLNLIYFK